MAGEADTHIHHSVRYLCRQAVFWDMKLEAMLFPMEALRVGCYVETLLGNNLGASQVACEGAT